RSLQPSRAGCALSADQSDDHNDSCSNSGAALMIDAFTIRSARPDDLAALPLIEHAAAVHFRTTPYAYLADEQLSDEAHLDHEYVWVVVDQTDQPIGFALVHLLD